MQSDHPYLPWVAVIILGLFCIGLNIIPGLGALLVIGGAIMLFAVRKIRKKDTECEIPSEILSKQKDSAAAPVPAAPQHVRARDLPSAPVKTTRLPDGLPDTDKFVVVDVETTGFSPENDRMIELAAVEIIDGKIGEQMVSFIDPERPVPKKITALTGITNEMLVGAPSEQSVICEFDTRFRGYTVVAHNAKFDVSFLLKAYFRLEINKVIDAVDTVSYARQAIPGMPDYKLQTLREMLDLNAGAEAHRALADALSTAELFLLCKDIDEGRRVSPYNADGTPRDLEDMKQYAASALKDTAAAPVSVAPEPSVSSLDKRPTRTDFQQNCMEDAAPSQREIRKARIAENRRNGVACCPKCGSASITANKKGYGIGKGVVGAAVLGPIGLVAGNAGRNKVLVTCLNCGHRWKP